MLEAYFNDLLQRSFIKRRLDLDDLSRVYLLQLMLENVSVTEFSSLFHLYQNAILSPPSLYFDVYRRLGDTSLITGGLFPSPAVATSYYIDMGTMAYRMASNFAGSSAFRPIFKRLSGDFVYILDILNLVAQEIKLIT